MAVKSKSQRGRANTGSQPLPILASMLRVTMEELVQAGVQVEAATTPSLLAFRIHGWGMCAGCGAFAPSPWLTNTGCPECHASVGATAGNASNSG